ncbi:MAG: hypothetical protein OEZ04_10380 [Nitrospinota bacterium]|nr:hypothetical protein [Nitrospinota bacterium]
MDVKKYAMEALDLLKDNINTIGFAALLAGVITSLASLTIVGGVLVAGPLAGGMFYIIMDLNSGEPFDIKRLFDGFTQNLVPLVLASLVMSLFISIGFMFLIVPGILLTGYYMFTFLYIVDRDMDFWGAMEASRQEGFQDHIRSLALGATMFLPAIVVAVFMMIISVIGMPYMLTAAVAVFAHVLLVAFFSCFVFRAYVDIVGLVNDPSSTVGGGGGGRVMTAKPKLHVEPPPPPPPAK